MPKRVLVGVVVSAKSNKTVVVRVERAFSHPIYKKIVRSTKKYAAHDEKNICVEGDRIKIVESAPFSKTKKWKVVE